MSLNRVIRSSSLVLAMLLAPGTFFVREVSGQSSPVPSKPEDPGRARFEEFLRSLAIPASRRAIPLQSPPASVPASPANKAVSPPPKSQFPGPPVARNPAQSSPVPLVPGSAGISSTSADVTANSPTGSVRALTRCTTCGGKLLNGVCFGTLPVGLPCPGPLPGTGENEEGSSPSQLMAGTASLKPKKLPVPVNGESSGDGTDGATDGPGISDNLARQGQAGSKGQSASSLSASGTAMLGRSAAAQQRPNQALQGASDQQSASSAADATASTDSTRFKGSGQDTANRNQSRGPADLMQQLQGIDVNAARVAAMANQSFQGIGPPPSNIPFDLQGLNGTLSQVFDAVNASAGVGPGLRWKVVRPAGKQPAAERSAISLEASDSNDTDKGPTAKQFNAGVVRSGLLSGPNNPLVLPPEIASVVFVVDCSGSMAGGNFERISAAISDAVAQMNAKQRFAVLLFNNVALQVDDGGLIPATDANKMLIAQQMRQVAPVGGTDPTDALLIAIQSKPESIVVFSDGEFDPQIVQAVTQLNRSSGLNIRINGVGIGTSVSSLKQLAALNGPGTYFEVP